MKTNIAIRSDGKNTTGKKIISALEALGGDNSGNYQGNGFMDYYYIEDGSDTIISSGLRPSGYTTFGSYEGYENSLIPEYLITN